jgi:hypothetical protein
MSCGVGFGSFGPGDDGEEGVGEHRQDGPALPAGSAADLVLIRPRACVGAVGGVGGAGFDADLGPVIEPRALGTGAGRQALPRTPRPHRTTDADAVVLAGAGRAIENVFRREV